jgi:hypothetical protein
MLRRTSLLAFFSHGAAACADPGAPGAELTPGALVSGDYVDTLRVQATRGRLPTRQDDAAWAQPRAVISDRNAANSLRETLANLSKQAIYAASRINSCGHRPVRRDSSAIRFPILNTLRLFGPHWTMSATRSAR